MNYYATTRRVALAMLVLSSLLVLAQENANNDIGSRMTFDEIMEQARLYYVRQDCELSQYLYQEALKKEPDNADANIGLGRSLVCRNALIQATDIYNDVIAKQPNNVEAYIELSLAYLQRFRNESNSDAADRALSTILRAEQIAPQDARVHNIKGIILYESRQFEAALSALETAVSLSRDLGRRDQSLIHANLGRVQWALNQGELATTSFRRAVSLNPTSAEAHNLLGQMYFRNGNCDNALFEMNQAYFLAPNSLSIVSNLAVTTFECNDAASAITYFQEAIDLDGLSLPGLYTYLAQAHLQLGQLDDALSAAQKGALLPPENAEAFYILGQAYQRKGNAEAARASYTRALELNPEYSEVQSALSTLQ